MSVIFNNESRPDLAKAIRTNYTAEYLFPKVFPVVNVYEEGGVFSAATRISPTADKARDYDDALTLNHLGNTPISYSTSKVETRIVVDDVDLKNKGDNLDEIQAEMANIGAEGTVGEIEKAAADLLDSSAAETLELDTTSPLATIAEGAYKVADYGLPTLVCSQSFLTSLLKIKGFTAPILKLFGSEVITGLISGADAVLQSVGGWMGLPGGILVGKDAFWGNSAFVVATRPEMQDPSRAYWTAKAKASLGATLTFLPRDTEGNPWFVDTVYLSSNKLNAVDVGLKSVCKVFNADAIVKIGGEDSSSSSSLEGGEG